MAMRFVLIMTLVLSVLVGPLPATQADTLPSVDLELPADGATLSGRVTLMADPEDDEMVTHVDFVVDGAVVGTANTEPYAVEWDSTSIPSGMATITAAATYTSSYVATSPVHTVTVENPTTYIDSGPWDTVTSTSARYEFSSSASTATFECKLDEDTWLDCTSPAEYTGLSEGPHTFAVRATDLDGDTDPTPVSRTWNIDSNADTAVLVGSGDISDCETDSDEVTASLLDSIPGTVFTTGDNAYPDGTDAEFGECYHPTWGRHKARTRPAVGNHEYAVPGAIGYFNYFGEAAGNPQKGYYSYDVGTWHVVMLNSNCTKIPGGCDFGSPQQQWLQADLAAHTTSCTIAMWHHPLFTSGFHDPSYRMQPIWTTLYDAGADLVVTGHDHTYERFAPQDPGATLDLEYGMRQFVVGSGGRSHYDIEFGTGNSEIHNDEAYGILKLSLQPHGYDWTFIAEPGSTFADSGTSTCHGRPPAPYTRPDLPKGSTVFSDGLESGDFSTWTRKRTTEDGTAIVQESIVKTGQYAAQLAATSTEDSSAYVRRFLAFPEPDLTVGGNFRVTTQGSSGRNVPLFRLFDDSGSRLVNLYRTNVSGDLYVGHSGIFAKTGAKLPFDTWGRIEMNVSTVGSDRSTIEVRLNGKEIYYTSSANVESTGVRIIQVGNDSTSQTFALVADDILVNTGDTLPPNPPTVTLSADSDTGKSSTDRITGINTPTLSGSAQTGSTVHVYNGTKLLGTISADSFGWQLTVSEEDALADGAHSLRATATDMAGNVSAQSEALSITVDTLAPPPPVIESPTNGSYNNTGSIMVTGAAEAGSTVQLLDGTISKGTVNASSSGNWSKGLTGLTDRAHTYTAHSTDAAGNTSSVSNSSTVIVDTQIPSAPTVYIDPESDTGISAIDNITRNHRPTFNGVADANSTVRIYDGTTLLGTTTASNNGNWTWHFDLDTMSHLTDGIHSITATATDAAGNTSAASTEVTTMIDTAEPTVPEITDPANSSHHNSDSVTLSGTAEPESSVQIFEGVTWKGSTTTSSDGTWNKQLVDLSDGSHSYTATATDVAGNTSGVSAMRTVSVDTIAPTVTTVLPANEATGVAVSTDVEAIFSEKMNPATISAFTFTLVHGGTSEVVKADVTYDAGSQKMILNSEADLEHAMLYTATITGTKDLAGNSIEPNKSWSFTTAPLDEVPRLKYAEIEGSRLMLYYDEDLDQGSVPGVSSFEIKVNGLVQGNPSLVELTDSTVMLTLERSVIFGQTVLISYTPGTEAIRDRTGNNAADLTEYPVGNLTPADTTPPNVTLTVPDADALVRGDVIVSADATDEIGIDRVEFRIDGVVVGTDHDDSDGYSINWSSMTTSDGAHQIVARAYDTSSNSHDSTSRTVNVDNTPPIVTTVVPASAASNVPLSTDVSVVFSEAIDSTTLTTARFTLVKQGTTSEVPASLSYDAGSKTATLNPSSDLLSNVTYEARVRSSVKDASGNLLTADKVWSFTTLKPDTINPSILLTSPASNGWVRGTVILSGNATDNVGVTKVEFSVGTIVVASDTTAPYSIRWNSATATNGIKTITARAVDAAGNSQTNTRTITVDNTRPITGNLAQSLGLNQKIKATLVPARIPVKVTWSGTDNLTMATQLKYQLQQRSMSSGVWSPWKLTASWATTKTRVVDLPPGTHQFRAQAIDLAGNLSPWKVGASFELIGQQEHSTAIKYSSGWSLLPVSLSGSYGGKVKYTSTRDATARYTFTGRNFAWVSQKSSNRGKAQVSLVKADGTRSLLGTVDLYSSNVSPAQLVYAKRWSDSIRRTIEVRVLGTHNASSTSNRVDIDAFVVLR